MFYVPQNQPNYSQDFINLIHSLKHMNQKKNKSNSAKIYYLKPARNTKEVENLNQLSKIKIKKIQDKLLDIKRENALPNIQNKNNIRLGIKGAFIAESEFSQRNRFNNLPLLSQKKRIRFRSQDYSQTRSFQKRLQQKLYKKANKTEISHDIYHEIKYGKSEQFSAQINKKSSQKITPWTKIDYYCP